MWPYASTQHNHTVSYMVGAQIVLVDLTSFLTRCINIAHIRIWLTARSVSGGINDHETFSFFIPHPRTFFHCFQREGKNRWRERGKYWLGASCMHLDQELNQQPRHVCWPGIEPTNFQLQDDSQTNWAISARAIMKHSSYSRSLDPYRSQWH